MRNILLKLFVGLFVVFLLIDIFLLFVYFQKKQLVKPTEPIVAVKQIEIVSDVEGYDIGFKNKLLLETYLEDFGFWKQNGVVYYPENQLITVQALTIHFTQTPQRFQPIKSGQTGEVYQALGQSYQDAKLDLYIFLHPEIAEKLSDEDLASRFDQALLSTLYQITNPLDVKTDPERQEELGELLRGNTMRIMRV